MRREVTIQEADLARDFAAIVGIYAANEWSHANDPGRLRTAVASSSLSIVALDDQEVVGFARALSDEAFAVYIADILVLPERQREGIGRQLLHAIMEHYPMSTFHHQVLIAERGAEGFYRRSGLTPVATYGLTAFIRSRPS